MTSKPALNPLRTYCVCESSVANFLLIALYIVSSIKEEEKEHDLLLCWGFFFPKEAKMPFNNNGGEEGEDFHTEKCRDSAFWSSFLCIHFAFLPAPVANFLFFLAGWP